MPYRACLLSCSIEVLCVVTGVLLWGFVTPALGIDAASPQELKAVALFRLPAFVEWPPLPADAASEPFDLCVLVDDGITSGLRYFEGRPADERPLRVRVLDEAAPPNIDCDILFVSEAAPAVSQERYLEVVKRGCLTVGDSEDFAREGGMVGLVMRRARLEIEVNLEAARKAGLKISSDLLSLARIVRSK